MLSKFAYHRDQILIGQIFCEEQEMKIVAGVKLARQARQLAEISRRTKSEHKDEDELGRERMRIRAIDHVITEGTVYTPILIRHEEMKLREGGESQYLEPDDVR